MEVDMPFHDILEDLNFHLAGRIEARKDKWLLYGDGLAATLHVKGGASTDFGPFTLGSVTVGPFDVGPPRLGKTIGPFTFGRVIGPFNETLDYDVKLKLKLAEMGIAYRLGRWSITNGVTTSVCRSGIMAFIRTIKTAAAQRFKWDETLFGPVAAVAFRF